MSLSFYGKRPGPGMRLDKLSLQFAMRDTGLIGDVLEAYERLILDAMRGDRTLFTTAEGIERLWEVSTPLLEAPPPVRLLRAGLVGTERDPSADRAARVAAAVRARVARPECRGRLSGAHVCPPVTARRAAQAARPDRAGPHAQPSVGPFNESTHWISAATTPATSTSSSIQSSNRSVK